MLQIHLHGLRCKGFHGLHPEESITGNWFVLHLDLTVKSPDWPINQLEETIDYGAVYASVKDEFNMREPLLENLCHRILTMLFTRFSLVEKASIRIQKETPPIPHFHGGVSVSLSLERAHIL